MQFAQLRERTAEFEAAGVEVIAITPEAIDLAAKLKRDMQLPWTILSDTQFEAIRAFGIFHVDEPKGRALPYPATYLIGKDGIVQWRHIGRDTKDRPNAGQIKEVLSLMARQRVDG